jgi:hypothetical protein
MYNHEYKPEYLMADYAEQITNGFIEVFGSNFKRSMCWSHASTKMDENCIGLD